MNFKKEILVPFRKILVPFRNTKDCHWQICSLNLTWTVLWEYNVLTLMVLWQITCLVCKWAWVQIQGVVCLLLFHDDILGSWEPRFKSGFHNSFWDYVVPDRIPWLWNYVNEIWERVLANSFSGIHKSKIICSAVSGGEPWVQISSRFF
jgi:hypothetical protein